MTSTEQITDVAGDAQWQKAAVDATLALCHERAYNEFDVSDIAARAHVEESLIRGRWPAKNLIVVESLLRTVAPRMAFPRTGDIWADLRDQLLAVVELFADPGIGPHLAALAAEANSDERLAGLFLRKVFTPNRTVARARFELAQEQGQLRKDIDLDTAVDLVFGPIWFRLLLGTGPLTADLAVSIAEHSLAGLATGPGGGERGDGGDGI